MARRFAVYYTANFDRKRCRKEERQLYEISPTARNLAQIMYDLEIPVKDREFARLQMADHAEEMGFPGLGRMTRNWLSCKKPARPPKPRMKRKRRT